MRLNLDDQKIMEVANIHFLFVRPFSLSRFTVWSVRSSLRGIDCRHVPGSDRELIGGVCGRPLAREARKTGQQSIAGKIAKPRTFKPRTRGQLLCQYRQVICRIKCHFGPSVAAHGTREKDGKPIS